MLEAPDTVLNALALQDIGAFKSAVDDLEKPVDHYMHCSRRLVVWVAREEFGPGVAYLLEKGAEPVSSALQEAIFFGESTDISAIEALLEGGVDPNKSVDGQSPLSWAGSVNSGGERAASIVRALLAHGAHPDGNEQPSPLHVAVRRPATAVARALLEAGADPNSVYDGQTPTVALMLELRTAFKRDKNYDDGSAAIASDFVPATLQALLAHGADPKIPLQSNGNSPLLFAISCKGCPDDVVELLCQAGPDTSETIHVNGEEHIDLLTYALLTDTPHAQQLALVHAGFPMDRCYNILGGGKYVANVAQKDATLCELLWNEAGNGFRRALLDHRGAKSGIHALTLCAVSGSETMVRALHQEGQSARQTFANGKSVADIVQTHNAAMLPLIEELAATEEP